MLWGLEDLCRGERLYRGSRRPFHQVAWFPTDLGQVERQLGQSEQRTHYQSEDHWSHDEGSASRKDLRRRLSNYCSQAQDKSPYRDYVLSEEPVRLFTHDQ